MQVEYTCPKSVTFVISGPAKPPKFGVIYAQTHFHSSFPLYLKISLTCISCTKREWYAQTEAENRIFRYPMEGGVSLKTQTKRLSDTRNACTESRRLECLLPADPSTETLDRYVSWLSFGDRVLFQTTREDFPLLEQFRFLDIFSSNLDKFFRERIGILGRKLLDAKTHGTARDVMRQAQRLNRLYARTALQYQRVDEICRSLMQKITALGFIERSIESLSSDDRAYLRNQLGEHIDTVCKVLLQEDSSKTEAPFLQSGQMALFVSFQDADGYAHRIIPLSSTYDPFLVLPFHKSACGKSAEHSVFYVNADEFYCDEIRRHLKSAKRQPRDIFLFSVLRSADLDPHALNSQNTHTDKTLEVFLDARSRLDIVRIDVMQCAMPESRDALEHIFNPFYADKMIDSCIFAHRYQPGRLPSSKVIAQHLPDRMRSSLTFPPIVHGAVPSLDRHAPLIDQILDHDVLLHLPYQSFEPLLFLLEQASTDERVQSISATLYRAAENSRVVRSLCAAARNGKEVRVLIELRARFDEARNMECAKRLVQSGAKVIFGPPKLKVHAKLICISLESESQMRSISIIATGNFNEETALQYTDYVLMSADESLRNRISALFDKLLSEQTVTFKHSLHDMRNRLNLEHMQSHPISSGMHHALAFSPDGIRQRIILELEQQIERAKSGRKARAWFKLNALSDPILIEKISRAAKAGVQIRLLVRGICLMTPPADENTNDLVIHSIVGRFLEHERVYIFGYGDDSLVMISSADFMRRNMERRIEAAVSIPDPVLKDRLIQEFQLQFRDTANGWTMMPNGSYAPMAASNAQTIDSQKILLEKSAVHKS